MNKKRRRPKKIAKKVLKDKEAIEVLENLYKVVKEGSAQGYLGEINSQTVVNTFDSKKKKLNLLKGTDIVSMKGLLDSITMKTHNLSAKEAEDLMNAFFIFNSGKLIDTSNPNHAEAISAYFIGFFFAKFLSNTKASISCVEVNDA